MGNLDLRPGRKCLLQYPQHFLHGHTVTLKSFVGASAASTYGGLMYADDWWMLSSYGMDGTPHGARATWLIPLHDDDEGKTLFGECEKSITTKMPLPEFLDAIRKVMHES